MHHDADDVSVVIAAKNEEATIADVVARLPHATPAA